LAISALYNLKIYNVLNGCVRAIGGSPVEAQRTLAIKLDRVIDQIKESVKSDEDKKCKCKPATAENIKMAVATSPMFTLQRLVSAPGVQKYVSQIESGVIPPPIVVDGTLIIDGNHRYIASLLCDKYQPVKPGQSPLTAPRYPLSAISVDGSSWR
jgi:hypothetical protein